ncbi:MAG: hypothetical protein IKN81_05300 [Oscillospiraceae bacterium]|nr:hypothetical protein [Oscillospiraceae bacterium]
MLQTEKSDKAREAQRQYLREWRKKNKDKVRQYNEKYWQRKGESLSTERGEQDAETQKG